MASAIKKFKVVHVLNQFLNLSESIERVLPDVQVKNVKIRGKLIKYSKIIQ